MRLLDSLRVVRKLNANQQKETTWKKNESHVTAKAPKKKPNIRFAWKEDARRKQIKQHQGKKICRTLSKHGVVKKHRKTTNSALSRRIAFYRLKQKWPTCHTLIRFYFGFNKRGTIWIDEEKLKCNKSP